MTPEEKIDNLLAVVRKRIIDKAKLYDGFETTTNTGAVFRHVKSCIEELGEVVSAHTRFRLELAKQECVDVMHSAFNLYFAIENEQSENKT